MTSSATINPATVRDLYLDLMKKCLTHSIWMETEDDLNAAPKGKIAKWAFDSLVAPDLEKNKKTAEDKIEGKVWPRFAHTMIGFPRLNSLEQCVRTVIEQDVPGDLIETGVWRGGSCIFMRAILKAYGVTDRTVWVADSFQGLPPPDPIKAPADKGDKLYTYKELAISLETVKSNFEKYNLLDDQVKFLKGWFKDTLPAAPMQKLAICRLDGDLYESTMDGLVNLYPKLSVGGFLIVDDYGALGKCRQAVSDYREKHGVSEPIEKIDHTGVYWRRER